MKKILKNGALPAAFGAALSLILSPASSMAVPGLQNQYSEVTLSAKDKRRATTFEKRVKAYVKLREQIEEKMPKLSKDATPEQIQTHKSAFQE